MEGQSICESVVHVLWKCPAYSSCREAFRSKFKGMLGDSFEQLSDIENSAYAGSEPLEGYEDMLRLLKEYHYVWEVRKTQYGEDKNPTHHQCQTLGRDPWPVTGGVRLRVSCRRGESWVN